MKKIVTGFSAILFFISIISAQTPFGNGTDGDLIIESGSVVNVDMVKSKLAESSYYGSNQINVNDPSGFSAGDELLIITMQDSETDQDLNKCGQYEFNYIDHIMGNEVYLKGPLTKDFIVNNAIKHQVLKVPQYKNLIINGLLTCSSWNDSTGGVICFRVQEKISGTGSISAEGKGFKGGDHNGNISPNVNGFSGESFRGKAENRATNYMDVNDGGGASGDWKNSSGGDANGTGGGGGGSYGTMGNNGLDNSNNAKGGRAGLIYGENKLERVYLGSGGGGTGVDEQTNCWGATGGNGGGAIILFAKVIENTNILANGANGEKPDATNTSSQRGGSGAGSGGSIIISCDSLNLTTADINAQGGEGGDDVSWGGKGGKGGDGRIRINSNETSTNGTITPDAYLDDFHFSMYHYPIQNNKNFNAPQVIIASIYHNSEYSSFEKKLYYRINEGIFQSIDMAPNGKENEYTAEIPALTPNSKISYYILASDENATFTMPTEAAEQTFNFKIAGDNIDYLDVFCDADGKVHLTWQAIADDDLTGYSVYRSQTADFSPGVGNLIAGNIGEAQFTDNNAQDGLTYYYMVSANYDLGGNLAESFSKEVSVLVDNEALTTIYGYVRLEEKYNHSGIKINFIPTSPSAVADSVVTDALGYFQIPIIQGNYKILCHKPFFADYLSPEFSFVSDTKIEDILVFSTEGGQLKGNVSGVWEDNFYGIYGDITVPAGDSLVIEAGATIRFYGNYHFFVRGYLAIKGNEVNNILIDRGYPHLTPQWQGIDFFDESNDHNFIKFANIKHAYDGIYAYKCKPSLQNVILSSNSHSGIYCDNSAHMVVRNTEITGSITEYGIYIYNSAQPTLDSVYIHHVNRGIETYSSAFPMISNSIISNNSNYGIVFSYSSGKVINCDIYSNTNDGIHFIRANGYTLPEIRNCRIYSNTDNGVEFYNSYGNMDSCDIYANTSSGIYCGRGSGTINITNSDIYDNSHGIYVRNGNVRIKKNRINNNKSDGIYKSSSGSTLTLEYNTIILNSSDGIEVNASNNTFKNNIIYDNSQFGIRSNSNVEIFQYNDLSENLSGQISDLNKMPVNTWVMTSQTPDGSPADIYRNFSENPRLVDAENNDFHLRYDSPCIDAGIVSVLDPDGSISDVGAFYRDKGNPPKIFTNGYWDQTVALSWEKPVYDSVLSYNVYYKLASDKDYTLFGNTEYDSLNVSGLENAKLYDFSVKGVYPSYLSDFSPKVSEIPGTPLISFNPDATLVKVPESSSIEKELVITNPGTRELNVAINNSTGVFEMDKTNLLIYPGNSDTITLTFPYFNNEAKVYSLPVSTDIIGSENMNYELAIIYKSIVSSTPKHFSPVAITGKSYTLFISNAMIDENLIQIGDEIGVYDDEICVGARIFDGTFNFMITVAEADGTLPGYMAGNPMSFKIYDTSAGIEMEAKAVYSIGNGEFGYHKFSFLNLSGSIYKTQKVGLLPNYFNLISFNQFPRHSNAQTIFSQIEDMQIAYDAFGNVIIPEYGVNSIGDIDFRRGYWVYTDNSDTIFFEGTAIDPADWTIRLQPNRWNAIAFLGNEPTDITAAFPDNVVDSISIVKSSSGDSWIPDLGQNSIIDLLPGMGYQVYLKGEVPVDFSYLNPAKKKSGKSAFQLQSNHFNYTKTGLPFIVVLMIDPDIVKPGDELALFDQNLCVGANTYQSGQMVTIAAWEGNDNYHLPGFTKGNPIQIKIHHKTSNKVEEIVFEDPEKDSQGKYNLDNYAQLFMPGSALNNKIEQLDKNLILYPNPCRDFTTFKVDLPIDYDIHYSVIDLNGKTIIQGKVEQIMQNEQIRLELMHMNPGVYQFTLESGKVKIIRKLVKL
jgi:parallel beta-helix repeat protein